MLNKVWFRTGIFLIILFVLIKLFMEVHSVFTPIATIIGSVFLPFLLSGFYFISAYLFKHFWKMGFPTLGKYFNYLLIAIIAIVVAFIAPIIISNVNNLIKATPTLQRDAEQVVNFSLNQMDKLPSDVTAKINSTMKSIGDSLTGILANSITYITSLISTIFLLIMVPFFLIYMLKIMKNLFQQLVIFKGERKVLLIYLKI